MWLDHLRQDLRGAVRGVTRYPIAALVAAVSLAAGIGATTATLTVRNVVFHKPPPLYQQPGQLSRVQVGRPDRPTMPIGSFVPGVLFATWREARGPLGTSMAAATPNRGVRDMRTSDRTESVPVRAVTPNFFALLGVGPEIGQLFSDAADPGRGPAPAVLSYRLWQRVFDSRPDVVGLAIWIDNQPYTVVGVLPRRFWFSEMNAPIWTRLDSRALTSEEALHVIVRRPAGATPEMLAAQLQNGLNEYTRSLPANERQRMLKISGIEGTPVGDNVSVVWPYVLAAAVLLTLLIACANVAVLMIAQWTAREHEIAVRASLGASRGRIVRALLTESVLLATCGGALGIAVTFGLHGYLFYRSGAADNALFDLSIDPRVFLQSAAVTCLTGLVAGVGPALFETRRLHANPLCAINAPDRARQQWRHALVVFEITVTVALLVVTSAMISGYQKTMAAQMGFRTRPLLSARVENPGGVPTAQLLDVLNHLPGVAAAAASTSIPYTTSGPTGRFAADATGSHAVVGERAAISTGFFSALDVPMRAGRAFTAQDSAATRTAIVNETLARHLFQRRDPIGSRIWIGENAYDIVGVVADYSSYPFQAREFEPKVFLPMTVDARDMKRVALLIRADGEPAPLVQSLRREVRDAAAGNSVTSSFTFDQVRTVMGQEMLVGTVPLFPLVAIGMLLTAAGIYGVLAFSITRRQKELAVRVAIGATGRDVIRLVTAQSLRLVAIGCLLGVGVTFGLARVVRADGGAGLPYDSSWPIFAIPVLVIVGIGALATWIPSRRALRINPAILLRTT